MAETTSEQPVTRLDDYTPYPYEIRSVDLRFDLHPHATRVTAVLSCRRKAGTAADEPLVLNGEDLTTVAVAVDGRPLPEDRYTVHADRGTLEIRGLPTECTVRTEVVIDPAANTRLSGLYRSGDTYCTQNEAQGFRRITWFPDRPDVMATFTTTVEADEEAYPHLLSNGNCIAAGRCGTSGDGNGRHYAVWHDPHPKPAYLFALVAGRFDVATDRYTTLTGREIDLRIYVEPGRVHLVDHAMASLKRTMRWDEETFGLEYDLGLFMIVGVVDFNSGAMENKGLNIFNATYLYASPERTTDEEYLQVERFVAHEYLHNWTGDRITLRDWFQLTLKEGLTVFRDEWYTATRVSPAVLRIDTVRSLVENQFPEDAGPLAHPIRPTEYTSIDNFYTQTVYQKGKEVIRMIAVIIGRDAFVRGMALYVQRHDGQAVTTEDFVRAMEDASGVDLSGFVAGWYHRAGTPRVQVEERWEAESGTYNLTLRQQPPLIAGATAHDAAPFHIPMKLGLVGADGADVSLPEERRTVVLTEPTTHISFTDLAKRPVPSLFRDFSAPVVVDHHLSTTDLLHLMRHDDDAYNRYAAGRTAVTRAIVTDDDGETAELLTAALGELLDPREDDPALASRMLTPPSVDAVARALADYDVHAALSRIRSFVGRVARRLVHPLESCYHRLESGPYVADPQAASRRALRNRCLWYLANGGATHNEPYVADAFRRAALEQLRTADNMTDVMGALNALNDVDDSIRRSALDDVYHRWHTDPILLRRWIMCRAGTGHGGAWEEVGLVERDPAVDLKKAGPARALYGTFARNLPAFHAPDGSGYRLMMDRVVSYDAENPQLASGLAKSFQSLPLLRDPFRAAMVRTIDAARTGAVLSEGTLEVLHRIRSTVPDDSP